MQAPTVELTTPTLTARITTKPTPEGGRITLSVTQKAPGMTPGDARVLAQSLRAVANEASRKSP